VRFRVGNLVMVSDGLVVNKRSFKIFLMVLSSDVMGIKITVLSSVMTFGLVRNSFVVFQVVVNKMNGIFFVRFFFFRGRLGLLLFGRGFFF